VTRHSKMHSVCNRLPVRPLFIFNGNRKRRTRQLEAAAWSDPAERRPQPPAREGSGTS